jgi:glycosyltransferase involved in cell wall biosynthesis
MPNSASSLPCSSAVAKGMRDALVSAVVPVFNEARTLAELYRRLTTALVATGLRHEIVFVDDGSEDGSGALLAAFAGEDPRVRVVSLSRNFGHQAALSAGLDHADGDAVVMIDADLQDPPELVGELVAAWRGGAEIVLTVKTRRRESWVHRVAFWTFYRLIRVLADVDIPHGAGIFSLMDRRVVEVLRRFPERARYLVGLRSWVGFRQAVVFYDRAERADGRSRVGFAGLLHLGLDAVFSFSDLPLRLITMAGFVVSAVAFLAGLVVIAFKLFTSEVSLPGWASTVVLAMVFGGMQLTVLGILGQYLARVLEEVKGRPLYVVRAIEGGGVPSRACEGDTMAQAIAPDR